MTKPKYGLMVLGPQAKGRVWLVLDGDVLYVDRNGNGDLTENGERICNSPALTFQRKVRGSYPPPPGEIHAHARAQRRKGKYVLSTSAL